MEIIFCQFFDKEKREITTVDLVSTIIYEQNNKIPMKHKYINSLGIGFDAYVGYLTNKSKYFPGIFACLLSVLRALVNLKNIEVTVNVNKQKIYGEKLLLSLGNGIASGGVFYLNPIAVINDGAIDLTIVDKVSVTQILTALPFILFNKLKKIHEAKQYCAPEITVNLKTPYFVHLDGEIISTKAKKIIVKSLPKAIKIIQMKS
ncbi:MAG: hypothetical protein CR986_05795 [Ignavibacteriae bacterium]|nr:MAG: hypothetical protein CR986_05795 [Ignavibacteriota bacterium]